MASLFQIEVQLKDDYSFSLPMIELCAAKIVYAIDCINYLLCEATEVLKYALRTAVRKQDRKILDIIFKII